MPCYKSDKKIMSMILQYAINSAWKIRSSKRYVKSAIEIYKISKFFPHFSFFILIPCPALLRSQLTESKEFTRTYAKLLVLRWNNVKNGHTWIDIGGSNRNHVSSVWNIFVNFIWITHRIENRCIVIQIQYIAIDGNCCWQTWMAIVLSLYN